MNALPGDQGPQSSNTIKIRGMYKKRPLTILIDGRSIHSFTNVVVAKDTKVSVERPSSLSVTVASRQISINYSKYPQFTSEMHDRPLTTNLRVLQLGGYDLILGVDWMKGFTPIVFDFDKYKLSLGKGLHKVDFLIIKDKASLRMIIFAKSQKLMKTKVQFLVKLMVIHDRRMVNKIMLLLLNL